MINLYNQIINEHAYLSKEEEDIIIDKALTLADEKNLSEEELDLLFMKLPSLRAYAEAYFDILGFEAYKEMETNNIRIIHERAWENEFTKI